MFVCVCMCMCVEERESVCSVRVSNGALPRHELTSFVLNVYTHTHTHTHTQVSNGALPRHELTSFVLYVSYISEASADVGDQWSKVQEV